MDLGALVACLSGLTAALMNPTRSFPAPALAEEVHRSRLRLAELALMDLPLVAGKGAILSATKRNKFAKRKVSTFIFSEFCVLRKSSLVISL